MDFFFGNERIWTVNFLNANQIFYQLNYTPITINGFEPITLEHESNIFPLNYIELKGIGFEPMLY